MPACRRPAARPGAPDGAPPPRRPRGRARTPAGRPRRRRGARPASRASLRGRTRPSRSAARPRSPAPADRPPPPDRRAPESPARSHSAGRRSDRRKIATEQASADGTPKRRPMTYFSVMRPHDLLVPTPAGLCCPPGGFHIDPLRPVAKALITHGHSDHARPGHGMVLATQETLDLMRLRYGEDFAGTTQAIGYGESVTLGGARVTFHPAGHVLGSAQIAVECKDLRIVASGDYKDAPDPTCAPFELVPCDVFITEATFGLPVFRHGNAAGEIAKLLHSVAVFPERAHLVGAYSLGKAQRVIALIRKTGYERPIYLHGAMEKITYYYQERGVDLGELRPVRGADKTE